MVVAVVAPVVDFVASSSGMWRYENYHDDHTYLITGTRMTKRNGPYRHHRSGKTEKRRNFPNYYCSPFELCCGNRARPLRHPHYRPHCPHPR